VTIARPVPFDVVIVADNSDSLSWSRNSLSAGLENLLSRVHGHEARFFVLTSTQYGATSAAALSPFDGKPLVAWRDSVTNRPYANPVTTYRQSCKDDKGVGIPCPAPYGDQPYSFQGVWDFLMPAPVAAITPAMTPADLAVQQKRIADAVLALGGGGAQEEQPLCTLGRYLRQKPELLPKNVVFVVLADEDDTSPPLNCLAGYHATFERSDKPALEACDTNCTQYTWSVNRPNKLEDLHFTCIPVDDMGNQHPERAFEKSVPINQAATCMPFDRACAAAELARATTGCGPGHVVKDCRHVCATQGYISCSLTRTTDAIDLCTQPFDEAGMRYANLADHCTRTRGAGWEQCTRSGARPGTRPGFGGGGGPDRVFLSAFSTENMITSIKADAERLFGARNHSFETIILDPTFSCPVSPGQSYATNLRRLATSAQDVFPLCQDYAPAIARIASFADYLVQTTFALELDRYEDVDTIVVTGRDGRQRTLRKTDYTYDRATRRLQISPGVLTAQDAGLAVNVARHCEPVVK
jgi:hypothetical protein